MSLALFKAKNVSAEQLLDSIQFNVHKLNHRPKPKKRDRIKIVSCFSEFGCEVVGVMYCIPRLLRRYPGAYIIAMGWHGREYLYRHLVDEFWELKPEYMWLREHARAFHFKSTNLEKLERAATAYGDVVPAAALGKYAVCNMCRICGKFWHEWKKQAERCPNCKGTVLVRSIFTDIGSNKPQAKKIPKPSASLVEWAKTLIERPTVGIFARGRKCYGRNLPVEFYVRLIEQLESMGYGVIWLGERQTTPPCPVEHVLDFSRMVESRNLEQTLAIISQLEFTVQFWTASTRLSGMMGVPFLLFESPEQIYVSYSGIMGAQEGKRLELTTFGPKKLVLAHYTSVMRNQTEALDLAKRAILEMCSGNYEEILGMVEDEEFTAKLRAEHYELLT